LTVIVTLAESTWRTKLRPRPQHCVIAAGLCVLIASWPNRAGLAQQTGSISTSKTAPAAPVTLNPNWLKLPTRVGSFGPAPALKQPGQPSAKIELPDNIKIGNSELRFDAGRHDVATNSSGVIGSADPTGLNSQTWLAQHMPQHPEYFGLTFSTPMH
jgi:hypothetical protein